MNHYQDDTKKKPLIQYHQKSKYNQPTICIKDKIKKDRSVQKQNNYDAHSKRFKDYNMTNNINKYHTQYNTQTTQHSHQGYKKSTLQPSNTAALQSTGNNLDLISANNINSNNTNSNANGKNLTFGFVKNTQQQQPSQLLAKQPSSNMVIDNENINGTGNHIISVNVNIQNLQNIQPNNFMLAQNNQEFIKKHSKYDIKPLIKRNNQPILRINTNQNNTNSTVNKNISNNGSNNGTERFMEKQTTHLERNNINISNNSNNNDRLQRKQKFKKQFQEKFNLTSSPIDKDFLCEEELDLIVIDKKPALLYDKKNSEKMLNINLMSQQQQTLQQQNPQRFNKKIDKKALQLKQLRQFQAEEDKINSVQCLQSVNVLFGQQQKYMVNPTYLEKNQKVINWSVRAILIDWMRQLSHQYSLKRDTYHLSVVLLDNFLAKKSNIQKQVAQVIGATTLFIASKLEQLQCRPSESFAESTQGICTDKDIQAWELQICKALQFKLNPPTICSLANRIMTQWDKYIEQVDYAMHHLCFQLQQKVYFKKMDESSYKFFRHFMQFIDCLILDIQTAQYKPILIVLSIMYLLLGSKIGGFTNEDIFQNFPRGSYYLLDRGNYFNDLFEHFVNSTLGLTLLQILPSVQYTASYFNLTLTLQKPILEQNEDELQQMNFQEYCSFQTYNRHMLKTVQTRFRGILNAF